MIAPRRRVLRSPSKDSRSDAREQARADRRRAELARNRVALKRWLTRLERATNTVMMLYTKVSRD